MAFQILSTKLYNPPIKPELIRRPRLVQRLEAGYQAGRCMSFVSAPAGFGKTTLISEWITGTVPVKAFGWVSLDEEDNDPVRFLAYLVTAIQKVHPEIGVDVSALLQSTQGANLAGTVEALINEITTVTEPFLIVLDDYHLIKNFEVHILVQLILKSQPRQLHLVLMTREDPPLPLPRMRVQGQVTEIREHDLRFTLSEARAFLVEAMGIDLSNEAVGKLTERTEGWAAGMQLAALALEDFADEKDRQDFIEDFTGSNRLIVDYLISEVLQRQPETTQQFLLSTSILARFCAELSEQVVFGETNLNRSQQILENLEKANMFLVPLDNQRQWYRYHHLFNEMLFHSLRRSAPEKVPLLHRRASAWFELRGYIAEAVTHAMAYARLSGDWEFPRRLLDQKAMLTLFQGQSSLVIEWCRDFPQRFLENAPEILIYSAWSQVLTFRQDYLDEVEEKVRLAESIIQSTTLPAQAPVGENGALVSLREWVTGQICVIRSQIMLGKFQTMVDPQELISLSLKGLELLPEGEKICMAICKINLAHAQTMQNHPIEAQQAFEDALPFMLESLNFLSSVTAIFYEARLAFYLGQPDRAETLCRDWKERFASLAAAAGRDIREVPATRGLNIVLSLVAIERGQLDEAEHRLVQALELLGWASWMELHGFIILVQLRFLRGDFTGARETLQRMEGMGPQHAACARAFQVLLDLKNAPEDAQVRARAQEWAAKYTPRTDMRRGDCFALGIGPYHCDAEYFFNLAWARVQVALGNYREAAGFITPALSCAEEHRLLFRVVELSISQALIFAGQGDKRAALDRLGMALEIADRAGYERVFDDGPQLDRLLEMAVEDRVQPKYARKLLDSFPRAAGGRNMPGPNQEMLVEPLSEREIEVLQLLASNLTTAQVAQRLYLSPNTLKAHTQNIYAKLDAHSRIEAVNKARAFKII